MYNDSVFYLTFILNMVLIVIENLHVPFLECREVNERCKGDVIWINIDMCILLQYTHCLNSKEKQINQYIIKTVATYHM